MAATAAPGGLSEQAKQQQRERRVGAGVIREALGPWSMGKLLGRRIGGLRRKEEEPL